MNQNFQMFKLDLKKVEEPEIKLPMYSGSLKKARQFHENNYFSFLDYAKALLIVWITTICEKYFNRWEY